MSTSLSVVSSNGLHIFFITDKAYKLFLHDESSIYVTMYDPTGRYFSYSASSGVYLFNLITGDKMKLNECGKFRKMSFSACGTFICYFGIRINGEPEDDNVIIYKTENGELMHKYRCGMTGMWAPQWSADGKMFLRLEKSAVHIHSNDFERYNEKLTLKGIERAAIAQCGNQYFVAVYVKGSQSLPHMVKIYHYPNLREPVNNRSFFKATDVELIWHPNAKCLLFMVHVDQCETSYYGENALYFMSADAGGNGETAIVSPPREKAVIHSAFWQKGAAHDGGHKFVLIYDNPYCMAIYNEKCTFLYNIDAPSRNLCQFSHCGNLMSAVGSGNVHNSLQLWNFSKRRMVGEIDCSDVNRVCWSGDDCYLATSTVSPSLRVNNGFVLWLLNSMHTSEAKADASGASNIVIDRETSLQLLGQPSEVYSVVMRPSLPPGAGADKHESCASAAGSFYYDAGNNKLREKQAPKASYVPPHLRNKPTAAAASSGAGGDKPRVQLRNGALITINQAVPEQTKSSKKKKNKNKKAAAKADCN